jgi:cytochrome c oxidase accessory protein FixG
MQKNISLYQSERKIYPREIFGIFSKWRWVFVWITQIIFYTTPWIQWGGRQAILFNIEIGRFYLFELVLYPQDLIYLALLLIICAISLFLFTAIAGRLWCGYACPQTVYSEIFLWIESKVEGKFLKREKLDQSNWSLNKVSLKTLKHLMWVIFSLWTGFTFVGYFNEIKIMWHGVAQFSIVGWPLFWILFYGAFTYLNAGYMREQVCKYMCPYAKFQSSMFDEHTLIVAYNENRGEPRKSLESLVHGDCIDCSLCVQVCPTGIDIRNGLQSDCLGCGLCIDACDAIMEKIGRFKNLIRYSTSQSNDIRQGESFNYRKIIRPRIILYSILLICTVSMFIYFIGYRHDYKFDVVKDRKILYRYDEDGNIENIYRIKVMNASRDIQKFHLGIDGLSHIRIDDNSLKKLDIELDPSETDWYIVTAELPRKKIKSGNHSIQFLLKKEGSDDIIFEKSNFLVPNER